LRDFRVKGRHRYFSSVFVNGQPFHSFRSVVATVVQDIFIASGLSPHVVYADFEGREHSISAHSLQPGQLSPERG
jgi:hypothetical protein